jgi:predicted AlkP superfamily phosphohydrolase/phosphomutase/tetratricopeptide (TPR) repeat protein
MGRKLVNKFLLIGWDGADWKVINRLMDAGQMPTLERLVNGGVKGNLATLDPPLSPMLWTSISTGMTADRHGIIGFTQPDPEHQRVRPVLSTSRKVKAIWNILMQKGYRTNVVGWWPSHPAEPVNGVYVSNFYHHVHYPLDQPQPLAPGTVHPEELSIPFAELRVHPEELTAAHLLPFVPTAAEVDQNKDKRLFSLAKIVAEASSIHSVSTWIMEHTDWDFMAVYYDALDHFSHGFMKFHPPRREGIPEELFRHYQGVVDGGYRYHDMMLERTLQLAGPDTTVMLISDHGFHSDHLRPSRLPKEPAGPAHEHRPYGIICLHGPNIKEDELVFGATLLDVAPTVLTLFGLPVGRDMRGKPLVQALREPVRPEFIPSWEDVPGDCGMHTEERKNDPWAEQQALDQLVALGYIEPPGANTKEHIARSVRESQFYLARVYLNSHQEAKALPLLEELYAKHPQETRYGLRLVQCYQSQGYEDDGLELLQTIRGRAPKQTPAMDLLEGKLLLDMDRPDEALAFLRQAEQAEGDLPSLHQNLGGVYLRMQRWADAEAAFAKALEHDGDSAIAHHGIGLARLRQERPLEAAESLLNAIGLLYHFPTAHFHLAEALAALHYHERAAEALEVCVSQAPGMRKAHLLAADIYDRHLGQPEKAEAHRRFVELRIKLRDEKRRQRRLTAIRGQAEEAFQAWTEEEKKRKEEEKRRREEMKKARAEGRTLGRGKRDKAGRPVEPAEPVQPADIVIVSGLPRSGTSMMMQMLAASGLPVLADDRRAADQNNLRGYFEYEKVKTLQRDNAWLGEADGKALKVIVQLLPFLHRAHRYRIVFMERSLTEIVRSQETMLANLGRDQAGEASLLVRTYRQQVARAKELLAQVGNAEILCVDYGETVADPAAQARRVNAFLGGKLDESAMAAAVDPGLYRQRQEPGAAGHGTPDVAR